MGRLVIPQNSRASFDSLDTAFQNNILALAGAMPHDSQFLIGTRTWAEQQKLYDQGRDKNGKIIDKSKIITNAKPGQSAHNYSLAADILPINPDTGRGDWNYARGFEIMAAQAKKIGLTAGHYWNFKDSPHIEAAGFNYKKFFADWQRNQNKITPILIIVLAILIFALFKINGGKLK